MIGIAILNMLNVFRKYLQLLVNLEVYFPCHFLIEESFLEQGQEKLEENKQDYLPNN